MPAPAAPSRHTDALQQFFISLVNNSLTPLTLARFEASPRCGWVQEPVTGDTIAAGDERIWCGMPWDLDCLVEVDLTLTTPSGGTLLIHFIRQYPAAASAKLQLRDTPHLLASTDLQRADSSSPFLMITIQASTTA